MFLLRRLVEDVIQQTKRQIKKDNMGMGNWNTNIVEVFCGDS